MSYVSFFLVRNARERERERERDREREMVSYFHEFISLVDYIKRDTVKLFFINKIYF